MEVEAKVVHSAWNLPHPVSSVTPRVGVGGGRHWLRPLCAALKLSPVARNKRRWKVGVMERQRAASPGDVRASSNMDAARRRHVPECISDVVSAEA